MKEIGSTPLTPVLMTSKLDMIADSQRITKLDRHQTSPNIIVRRETARLQPTFPQTTVRKDKSIYTTNKVTGLFSHRQHLQRCKILMTPSSERQHSTKTGNLRRSHVVDHLDHSEEKKPITNRLFYNPRLVRNLTSLDEIPKGDVVPSSKQNTLTKEIYNKIKRDSSLGDRMTVNSQSPDTQDTILTTKSRTLSSTIQTSCQHLPSIGNSDDKHDDVKNDDDHFNLDNPRYQISITGGLAKYSFVAPSGDQREEQLQLSRNDQPQHPRAESLPFTIMDIAKATASIRRSRTGECLFNNDADVKRFRELIRDPETRLTNSNIGKLKHINYCNREKTKLIIKWLGDVDPKEPPEGTWSCAKNKNNLDQDLS